MVRHDHALPEEKEAEVESTGQQAETGKEPEKDQPKVFVTKPLFP